MAVRCVAVSSVPPSPVTSTAVRDIATTGRAAPSACVKVGDDTSFPLYLDINHVGIMTLMLSSHVVI